MEAKCRSTQLMEISKTSVYEIPRGVSAQPETRTEILFQKPSQNQRLRSAPLPTSFETRQPGAERLAYKIPGMVPAGQSAPEASLEPTV